MHQPFTSKEGQTARIGASIGIALTPEDACSPDDLINLANVALYEAKDAGKEVYRFSRHAAVTQSQSDGLESVV